MSKRDAHKDLLAALQERGLLEFGSVIPRELVHQVLGLEMPKLGTKAQFDAISLAELAAIDYCRGRLLESGKYLAGTDTGYRILLPSENQKQVELYISSADKKLSRALKLLRNSPVQANTRPTQLEARIHLKRQQSRHQVGGNVLA